jgi:hypothetical protein
MRRGVFVAGVIGGLAAAIGTALKEEFLPRVAT